MMRSLPGLVLSCALIMLTPAAALAQMNMLKGSTPQERADLQTQWMQDNLSLDTEAAAAVSAINLKYAQQNQSLLDSGGPRYEKIQAMKRSADAKDAELKAVLTPEQYGQYEQKKSELRQQLQEKVQARQQTGK